MNAEHPESNPSRLAHLPVSFFSTVMGMTGLAIAWQKAHLALGASPLVWQSLAALSSALFVGLLIVYAVLSWIQGGRSPLADVIARLCEPVLRPFRRVIPLMGGFDLSPLVALVVLQVAMIVLGHLQASVMR